MKIDATVARERCMFGKGTRRCAFLLFYGDGHQCAKGTPAETVIRGHLADGTSHSIGNYCDGAGVTQPQLITLPVTVDYGASVEALANSGNYDFVSPDITSANFPTARRGVAQLDAILVPFAYNIEESHDAVKELDKMGLRPGVLHELLAVGAQHPDEQSKHPIVAMGSVVTFGSVSENNVRRLVPYLYKWDVRRWLGLFGDGGWDGGFYRFLAFPKQAVPNP